jgi:hypothetical protein
MTVRIDSDRWVPGPSILDTQTVAALSSAIETTALIVEHRFYRGSRAPDRLVFDDGDDLLAYLRAAAPGDAFRIWRFETVCQDGNALVVAKRPDSDGTVPESGAY